jgi:hypothetical protein
MYRILTGGTKASSVRWRNSSGQKVTSMNLAKGQTALLSPAVYQVAASKSVKWRFSSGLEYTAKTGTVKVTKGGKQQIQALTGDGKVISTFVVASGLDNPTLKSASNVEGKKINVSWGGVSGVSGYQVQCSTSSGFSSAKSFTVSKTSATLKGFSSGKTYYVRVRAYKGNTYSPWSGAKKVKVKK